MYEREVTEVEQLIQTQNQWRDNCINLIASENVLSQRARSQAGSDFAHRYAEGHPGERYYRGTAFIDDIENQLKTNLKILFECDHSEVRPISGTNANEAFFYSRNPLLRWPKSVRDITQKSCMMRPMS